MTQSRRARSRKRSNCIPSVFLISFCLLSFQPTFKHECEFKETLLPNNYNAYESSVYKGFYIALSKHGRVKRGNKASTSMTVTHFLPRIWARPAEALLFLHMRFALRHGRLETTNTKKRLQEYYSDDIYCDFIYVYLDSQSFLIFTYMPFFAASSFCTLLLVDMEALPVSSPHSGA